MEDEDLFADFSELSEDDFRVINQVTQFMGLEEPAVDTPPSESDEVQKLREELAKANQRATQLERSVNQLQQDRMTREGEVTILREKLNKLDKERAESAMRATQKIQQTEQDRIALEEEYRRTTEALRTQLKFKDQELEAITTQIDHLHIGSKSRSGPIKERKLDLTAEEAPEGFEELHMLNKKRSSPPVEAAPIIPEPVKYDGDREEEVPKIHPIFQVNTPRQVIDTAIEAVDSVRDIRKLLPYDYEAILKKRLELQDLVVQLDCVMAALEISYDRAIEWLRQPVLIYFSRLVTATLHLKPELSISVLNKSPYPPNVVAQFPEYKSCQIIPKMCQYLNKPILKLHHWLLRSYLETFMCGLLQASHSVPMELKDLLESGVLFSAIIKFPNDLLNLRRYVQFMFLMCIDRATLPLLLKPHKSEDNASILAFLVKLGIDRMKETQDTVDEYLLTLTEFLHMLAMKNLLPLNVAFDKRFLTELVKYVSFKVHAKKIDYEAWIDFDAYINSLHCVFIEKKANMRANIGGLFCSLNYIAEKLLDQVEHFPQRIFKESHAECERWIELRESERHNRPLPFDPESLWGRRDCVMVEQSDDLRSPSMQVSDEELALNQIPLWSRDVCAHLLIPLNRCRRENYYLPFKCKHERHIYEACLYKDFLRRQKVLAKQREEEMNKENKD